MEFPRLFDLYQRSDHSNPQNYFLKFLENYRFLPELWEKAFPPIELNLQRLDPSAWQQLSDKALPCVTERCADRGHFKLFNYLDEARGYVVLADRGYKRIRFIETNRAKSPDLRGELGGSTAILEVKSINRSDDDIDRLAAAIPEAHDVLFGLSDNFKNKLRSTVDQARNQLAAFPEPTDRKIILIVVRWDFDYMFVAQNYRDLASFLDSLTSAGVEIVHQFAV